jgi:hypothetical protein
MLAVVHHPSHLVVRDAAVAGVYSLRCGCGPDLLVPNHDMYRGNGEVRYGLRVQQAFDLKALLQDGSFSRLIIVGGRNHIWVLDGLQMNFGHSSQ